MFLNYLWAWNAKELTNSNAVDQNDFITEPILQFGGDKYEVEWNSQAEEMHLSSTEPSFGG